MNCSHVIHQLFSGFFSFRDCFFFAISIFAKSGPFPVQKILKYIVPHMKKNFVSLLTFILGANPLFSQLVTNTYDFALVTTTSGTTDPSTPPSATGLTFGSFNSVGYIGNPNASGRFSWTTNSLGGVNLNDNFANFTGNLDSTKYFGVTLTPQSGFSVNLDTITFTIQRSGTGIRNYAVRSSLDGFAANLPASINPANSNLGVDGANNFQWLLDATITPQNGSLITLDSSYDSLTAPVSFRFYGWNAEAVTGTFSIDNVAFGESVLAVPEPSTLVLGALGLGGLCVVRRIRQRISGS